MPSGWEGGCRGDDTSSAVAALATVATAAAEWHRHRHCRCPEFPPQVSRDEEVEELLSKVRLKRVRSRPSLGFC